jgi:small subunit ribosomal protein S20
VAHHKSAVKRHKQSLDRAARNKAARSRVKNAVKAVRAAVQNKDRAGAESLLPTAASVLAKAAGKKAIHRRKAARKLSRLTRAVNAVSVQAVSVQAVSA